MKEQWEQPLVSVLMTVYNREAFIEEAIASVINSTYQNWELIIVDDKSTDNSVALAKKYKAKDPRIRVFENAENLGDYPNRNKAASYAKGKYLKYVDADDKIYPYGLEQLVYYMEQHPNVGYGLCSLDQDKNAMFPIELTPYQTYKRHYIEHIKVFHKAPLSSIIKKSAFNEVGGFAKVRHYGDFDLWHRLAKYYNVLLMQRGIVWYRVSNGQEASKRRENPINRVKTLAAAHQHILDEVCPLKQPEKRKLDAYFLKQKAAAILFGYRKFGFKKGKEMKEYAQYSYFDIIKYKFVK